MYIRSVPVKSNVRFVERAERVIEEYGKQAATPDEARELLNLNIQVYDHSGVQGIIHLPANNTTAIPVNDVCQIQEAVLDGDIGDVD